jgi:chromate transporter
MAGSIPAMTEKSDLIQPRPTLAALFTAFLQISMCAFGGPLVWARRTLVMKQQWLSDREFGEILSFCQFMPGPNVVSLTVCVGAKFRGAKGALAALVGALLLSYAQAGVLQGTLRGVAAAAAGLIIGTGLRLLSPYRRRPAALLFAALGFAGLALAKLPLLIVVIVLVPLGIAAAGRQSRAAA